MISDIIPFTISTNMDDFLLIMLKENRSLFEKFYVVTSPDDSLTQELCKKFNVDVIIFNDFYNKAKFNKSGGINYAQKILHNLYPEKWMLIIDSDIILPNKLENIIKDKLNDKTAIYGLERYDAYTYSDYINETNLKKYTYKFAGYFQLYFNKSYLYNKYSQDAGACDIIFLQNFKNNKILLESNVIHLGRDRLHWEGRVVDRLF